MKRGLIIAATIATGFLAQSAFAGSPYYGPDGELSATASPMPAAGMARKHCVVSRRAAAQYKTSCHFNHM